MAAAQPSTPKILYGLVLSDECKRDTKEVEAHFFKQFCDELYSPWTLTDPMNNHHQIEFTAAANDRFVSKGWNRLRSFYGRKTSMYWISLNFIGHSKFLMEIYDEYGAEISYPSTVNDEENPPPPTEVIQPVEDVPSFFSFTVTLTLYKANGSQLNLPKEMAKHLLKSGRRPWILRGPDGSEIKCKILRDKQKTRFGRGWYEFCRKNKLREGDTCTFLSSHGEERTLVVYIDQA